MLQVSAKIIEPYTRFMQLAELLLVPLEPLEVGDNGETAGPLGFCSEGPLGFWSEGGFGKGGRGFESLEGGGREEGASAGGVAGGESGWKSDEKLKSTPLTPWQEIEREFLHTFGLTMCTLLR